MVPAMGDAYLWEVPLNGKCSDGRYPFIGGAPLLEVPLYGKCPVMCGAPLWVPFKGGASLRKVLLSGRYPLWLMPLYGSPLWDVLL